MSKNRAGSVRTNNRAHSRAQKLVASFASFAVMAGVGFIGQWSQSAIPQAEAATLVGGQPTMQGTVPNWQLLLNYNAVWANGGLAENATYWTADVSPTNASAASPGWIVGTQYNWADDMNTFQTAPVLGVQRTPTAKPGPGSTTTNLGTNNWQSTAMTRIGGTKNNPGGPLTIYFWDNGGSQSVGGLNCNAAGGGGSGYTPIIRVTSMDPNMYYACMPIATSTSSAGGFNTTTGVANVTLGNSGAYGGEADQYTGNIYISSAYGLDAVVDGQNQSSRAVNSNGTMMYTVWNPETGMYTLSGSVQPGDWSNGMASVPQERVALRQRNDGAASFASIYASADFVMDADGNIYVYVASSNSIGSTNNNQWYAKIIRIEPARDSQGNIVQGTISNPWRYYVVGNVAKDPAFGSTTWGAVTSTYGNAFINGQMYVTASAGVSSNGVPATGTTGADGTTRILKIDPLTLQARPAWSTLNVAPLITATSHDSASPQGAQNISGRLYNDVDGDGVLPRDEEGTVTAPGLYNQTVALYDSSYKLLSVHQTDTSGRYDFIVSGKEDSVYYLRPVQVQIPVTDGTAMINAAQTWALGSRETGMNATGTMVTNEVEVMCSNAPGGIVTDENDGAGAPCYGALTSASADPAVGAIGSTGDPATWLTYAKADLHTAEQVPTADFGFTISGSYGDSAAGPATANIPVHINTDPATSVWFGGNPGNYTNPVLTNTHSTDDGVVVTTYDGVTIPLQGTILAATGAYTITGNLSGQGKTSAQASGWVSGVGTLAWNTNPAWLPLVSGETASGSFKFQQSGVVSGSPEVQFRAQVSTVPITQPGNSSGQYYSADVATGGPNWTTPGEIEDHTFRIADAVYRPAVKTTSGSATFTVDGQRLGATSAAFTLGTAAIVSANTTKTVVAEAPNSSWVLVSATVKRTSDGAVLENASISKVSDTVTQVTWPASLGDDVRVELVYGKAPDPMRSQLSIDPNSATVGGTLTATATIRDGDGNLLGNQVVSFSNLSDDVIIERSSCTTNESTGSCSVDITSDIAGTYTDEISAKVGAGSAAANVTGSPATVIFTPGKGDPNKSSLAVTPAGPLEVGTGTANTYTATVLVKDSLNNTVSGQEVRLTVTNLDGTAVSSQTKLSDDHCFTLAGGSCSVTLTSTKPGMYLVSATIASPTDPDEWVAVQGSSATVSYVPKEVCVVEAGCVVQPGVTNVTHVKVTKDNALNDGVATDQITAYTYDEWGNPVSARVQISTADSALKLAGTGLIITDAITGEGTLTATSTVSGSHTATASVNGTSLSHEHGSPMQLNFTAQAAVSSKSTLVLSSTEQEVGTVVTATVTTIDANDQTVAGTEVKFGLDGPTYAAFINGATCTSDAYGTCSVTFTDIKPETVTVRARLGSSDTVDIKDSPAETRFKATIVDSTKSTISARPSTVAANGTDTSTVTVTLRDQYENLVKNPSDTVVISTSLGTAEATRNNGDGTYTASVSSAQAGTATVGYTLNGVAQPATDQVNFTTTAFCPSHSRWTVTPATTATVADGLDPRYPIANGNSTGGDYYTATLSAYDCTDNAMNDLDTSKIEFSVTGLPTLTVSSVVNNNNGTYTVTIASKTRGDAIASMSYDEGAKVGPSVDQTLRFQSGKVCIPSTTVTCGDNPAKQTRAEVNPNGARADGSDTDGIIVYAFDKDGNPVEATFTLLSIDSAVLAATSITTDPVTGQGKTTATSTSPGSHRLQVSVGGQLLPSLPQGMLTLSFIEEGTTPPPTPVVDSLNSSWVVTPTTTAESGTDPVANGNSTGSDYWTGVLTVRDQDNAPMSGVDVSAIVFTADSVYVVVSSVTNTGNGTYTATFTSANPGSPTVSVRVGGGAAIGAIAGQDAPTQLAIPFQAEEGPVVPKPPVPETSTLSVDRTTQVAGGNVTATVTARDVNNDPVVGAAIVVSVNQAATIGPDGGKTFSCLTETGGVCSVTLTDTVAEQVTVRATLLVNGNPADILGSPTTVTFTDAGPCVATASAPCIPDPDVPDSRRTRVEVTRDYQPMITGTDVATVYVFDRFGNAVAGAAIASTPADPALAIGTAIPVSDARGESAISYTSSLPGGHEAAVTINGDPVAFIPQGSEQIDPSKSSPVMLNFVHVDTPISALYTTWTVTPTTTAASGSVPVANGNSTGSDYWTGVLYAKDQNNLPKTNLDVSAIHFAANPAADVTVSSVTNNGDGTYTVRFTSAKAGSPTASVTYGTGTTKFGPVTDPLIGFQAGPVCIPLPGVSCAGTYAEVMPDGALADGKATNGVVVHAADKDGNPVSATFRITSTDGQVAIAQQSITTPAMSGTASTTATSTVGGKHQVTVTVNGVELPQSPLTMTFVTTLPSPMTSTLTLNRTTQAAGGNVTATVTARDADNRTVAGAAVVVSVNGKATVGPVGAKSFTCSTDEFGVCTVTITDNAAEEVIVRATVNQNGAAADITGSPATVTFTDAGPCVAPCQPDPTVPNDKRTRVEVAPDYQPIVTGTDVATVYVFDRFGNPVAGAAIASTVSNPALVIGGVIASTNARGESAISYTSSLPGGHEATVTINGIPVGFIPQGSAEIDPSKSSPVTLHFVDTVAPDAPTVTSPKPGAQINDPTPDVVGKAEPGSTVTVTDKDTGAILCTTTADASGNYTCTPDSDHGLGDGAHTLVVTAADPSGNVSPSTEVPVNVDTIAPQTPAIDVANGTEISGQAEPGMVITVTVPGVADPMITTADENGKWLVPTPVGAIDNGTVRVTATDPAGNTSPEATVSIDVTAPGAPSVEKANAVQVSGTAEPGSTVTVVFPDGTKLTATADPDSGAYAVTTPAGMPDGGTVTVTATDKAGNVSSPTIVALDTGAPADPAIDRADAIEISGTAEPGSTVTIKVPGVDKPSTVVVGEDGSWKIATPKGATDGTVRVTAADPAGNVSREVTRQIDVTAPSKPVVNPSNGSEVSGSADPGSAITITDENGNNVPCKNADGTISPSVVVGQDGTFVCVPDRALAPGSSITVVSKDASGLESEPVTVTIGDVAIEAAYPERHRLESQVVTGYRFNVGEQVCLTVHSDPWTVGCENADGQGTVTFTFSVPRDFEFGVHTVTVTGMGSGLAASTSFAVVDTIAIATGGTSRANNSTVLHGVLAVLIASSVSAVLGARRLKCSK